MRSHVQSTRYWVFALIDSLMAHHRDGEFPKSFSLAQGVGAYGSNPATTALKKMGDDFVASYIKVAEGEKDPRNLMMGFSIMRVILIEFDPYLHLEVSRPRRRLDVTNISISGPVRYRLLLLPNYIPSTTK